ncbi:hypothetical protein MVEG_05191 [Podila verticillata NRRL 6337]|nr:hypothetical protein MVEG_05191 [Podila verticillata NRRL 6337]
MNYIDEKGIIQSKNKTREPHHQDHDLFPSYSSSPITKIITMTCPKCEKEQQPLELLDIATFRSSKFVERIVNDHKIRCPTTAEKSCQWIGTTDDIENHLAECRFRIQHLCPHRPYGCLVTGTIYDIAAHLPMCQFCNKSRSITSATTSISGKSVGKRDHGKSVPRDPLMPSISNTPMLPLGTPSPLRAAPRHLQRAYNPLSPPQSSPVMDFIPAQSLGLQQEQDLKQGLEEQDGSFIFPEMDARALEDELDRYEEEQRDGYFSQMMEGLEVNDNMNAQDEPVANTEYPLPEELSESQQPTLTPPWHRQQLESEVPNMQFPESQQSTSSSVLLHPNGNSDKARPSRRRRNIISESDDEESTSQGTGKKMAIGMAQANSDRPSPTYEADMDDNSSDMMSPPLSQEFQERRGVRTQLPPLMDDKVRAPPVHHRQRSPMPNNEPNELPTQSPRTAVAPSKEDIPALFSSFAAQFCSIAQKAPVCSGIIETRSYLPLLVYTPRYTKSRRRKLHRDRARTGTFLTPIVQSIYANTQIEEGLTPDITSPENSIVMDLASFSSD